MTPRRGKQKGAQRHAEGQHGEKTRHHFIDTLHGRHGGSLESEGSPQGNRPESGAPVEGHHRLFEERQQHDIAERASEANRSARERSLGREPRGADGSQRREGE